MELSYSREATSCAVTQEFSNILWNPRVHYRVRKSPPLVLILSQINLAHITTSYLPNIHFNIIHVYVYVFLVVSSFILAFTPKSYMHATYPHACYMPCSSHPP
jgi:hypothetical protein